MNAIIGGIVAQEVMKACSGKFHPIFQWFYLDAIECLLADRSELTEENCCPIGSRYDLQTSVFGRKFQSKIEELKYFIIGAGAFGCELLKNFALMGVGTNNGFITVADIDLIKKSDLSTNCLFRPSDIGKDKSSTAARVVKSMNSQITVCNHKLRVCPATRHIYHEDFFEVLDGVATALDNEDELIFVNKLCVYHTKPLLQSSTLGTMGNTKVIIPFLSSPFILSQNPQKESTSISTPQNFPYIIEHTLQWAKKNFEDLFSQNNAAKYVFCPEAFNKTLNKMTKIEQLKVLESVETALVYEMPITFADCVTWARCHWQEQYSNQIEQLLIHFPPDQENSSGEPFWSKPKRCPEPLTFDVNNPLHVDYVVAGANLKAKLYGIPVNRNREEIARIAATVVVPKFSPSSDVLVDRRIIDLERLSRLKEKAKNRLYDLRYYPQEFKDDDDSNFHIDFVTSASNLRAANYKIPAADRNKSKLIVSKIIPAIITTISVSAGLACLELIKLTQRVEDLSLYRNTSINLALLDFQFFEPAAARKLNYYDTEFTMWTHFEIRDDEND